MLISTLLLTVALTGADKPKALIRDGDYPSEALANREEGTVQARLTVGTDGRVKACEIVMSSKSRSIDFTTCEILRKRAKFTPAMDDQGRPTEGTFTTPPIRWALPR